MSEPFQLEPPVDSPSSDRWIEYLRHVLFVRHPGSASPIGRDIELHHALINIHRTVQDGAVRMAYDDALAAVLENSVASGSLSEVFTILQVVAYAKPTAAKQTVRRAVLHEVFVGKRVGTYDLHGFALAVAGKYMIDDRLRDYIDRSVRNSSDLGYLLTCFRIRSIYDPEIATRMLLNLVGLAVNLADLRMITRELRGFTALEGCRPLLRWYLAADAAARDQESNLATFTTLLLSDVVGAAGVVADSRDRYRTLLAAAMLCEIRPLAPDEYVTVGSVPDIDDDEMRNVLKHVWDQQMRRGWRVYVLAPDEYENAEPRDRDAILIMSTTGRASLSLRHAGTAARALLHLQTTARPARRMMMESSL